MIPRRAVVITLRGASQRTQTFLERWRVLDLPVPLTVHVGVDGQEAYPRLGPRRAAEEGCVASHLQVLRAHDGPLLVLEDDALFHSIEPLLVAPPRGWMVARLGGLWRNPYRRRGWHAGPAHGSHAYLVSSPGEVADQLEEMHRELVASDLPLHPVMDLLLNRLPNTWVWGDNAVEQDYRMPSSVSGLG